SVQPTSATQLVRVAGQRPSYHITGCGFCKASALLAGGRQSCSIPEQCRTSTQAKNPAISCILCQAVHGSPPHFSDHTTLVAQFIAVCSSSMLTETLGYAVSFSRP